jgi:metallo-beta-lactamase class B
VKRAAIVVLSFAVLCFVGAGASLIAQNPGATPEAHVAAAKAAAGQDFLGLFSVLCPAPAPAAPRGEAPQRGQRAGGGGQRQGPPDRSTWHAEPVKVFDNLYWLGQTEYSVWAVTTSAGIIVIDTIYDYSVEDEVAGGLKKLGFDPANIKYAIVSHGHADHSGGAKFLQDHYGTRIILSAADWDLLDRSNGVKPARDMVATDGQKLTLGDTTLTMFLTPGHTAGTISTLIPVKDQGRPHVVAEWGGTLFNFGPNKEVFQSYIRSAQRFTEIVRQAGADVIISNHTIYDESKTKLPLVAKRKAGEPHPYVVGADGVLRYLKVAQECATAALMRLPQ